ncbi:MAG: cation:proton antiporter [Woeseiaceae bacterium]|nr:cation:proton antiporter [Woeseiaceae bacterium]
MEILYLILVLLVVTRVFAELAERVHLPAIVGELVAGVSLGLVLSGAGDIMPMLWSATQSETYVSIVDLGMFFLMLLAGIRMEPLDFAETSKTAILVAIGGMLVPISAGVLLGLAVLPESPLKLVQCLLLGTALAITAVPVAVRIFMDVGELDSRVGKTVIAAALWDDLISLFLLAIVIAAMSGGNIGEISFASIAPLVGKVLFFFAVTIPTGFFLFPIVGRYFKYLRFPEVDFSMLLIAALAYATFAESMDMHFIIGAFLAGMFFHPKVVDQQTYEHVEGQMSGITQGFLAPIFFVSVGLHLDFSALLSAPVFVIVFILIALVSKIVGAGLPAYWVGLSQNESLMVGVGMSGRGAVELIVAGVALEAGIFLQPDPPTLIVKSLYSAIVIMALVTTVLTPIILRRLVDRKFAGEKSSR